MKHVLVCVPLGILTACSGQSPVAAPTTPTSLTYVYPPIPALPANYMADATVLTPTPDPYVTRCTWQTGAVKDINWRIEIRGDSITLDRDPEWAPDLDDTFFTGKASGHHFSAAYDLSTTKYELVTCPVKGATLVGDFDEAFSTWDAVETITIGPPAAEVTAQRQWRGPRTGFTSR